MRAKGVLLYLFRLWIKLAGQRRLRDQNRVMNNFRLKFIGVFAALTAIVVGLSLYALARPSVPATTSHLPTPSAPNPGGNTAGPSISASTANPLLPATPDSAKPTSPGHRLRLTPFFRPAKPRLFRSASPPQEMLPEFPFTCHRDFSLLFSFSLNSWIASKRAR